MPRILPRLLPTVVQSCLALVPVLLLSGCDARQLTAPGLRAPQVRSGTTLDAPQALGGGTISGPLNTSPGAVSGITNTNLAAFPESAWVVVNVSGQFTFTYNEGPCAERQVKSPNWPCRVGSPTVAFASTPWDNGPVTLRATYDNGGGGTVPVRGSGGTANTSGTAIGLFFASRSGTLSGKANIEAFWAWDPNFGDGPYSYNVSGGYVVTATAVPSPIQLTEGSADSTGTRTYTLETLYGLQLTTPVQGWPAGAVFWSFVPGDSVSDIPHTNDPAFDISSCTFQLVCRFRPPGPGRVQAQAYVEERLATVRNATASSPCLALESSLRASRALAADVSPAACSQQPKLVLTCTGDRGQNEVTRGQKISCEVKKEPSSAPGNISITKWSFDGKEREGSDAHDLTWGGTMVHGGTIHVEGKIGSGDVAPAEAQIVVANRDWSGKTPDFIVKEVANGEDERLTLPTTIVWAHDLGASNYFQTAKPNDSPPEPVEQVDGGPNDGIYYFPDSFTYRVYAYYVLNRDAMRRGSNFYNKQDPDDGFGGSTRIGGTNWCGQGVVSGPLLGLVEAHELEHIRVYRVAITRELPATLQKFEPLTGDYNDLLDAYEAEENRLDGIARPEANAIHQIKPERNPNLVVASDAQGKCALRNENGQELTNDPNHP